MRALKTVLFVGLLVAGCQEGDDKGSASEQSVTVQVTRASILDDTYVAADTARVHNEDYGDAFYGVVTLSAKPARGESDRTPVLNATVQTSTGDTIKCEMFRSVIWSSDTEPTDLDLKCTRRLDLASVTGVSLPE